MIYKLWFGVKSSAFLFFTFSFSDRKSSVYFGPTLNLEDLSYIISPSTSFTGNYSVYDVFLLIMNKNI